MVTKVNSCRHCRYQCGRQALYQEPTSISCTKWLESSFAIAGQREGGVFGGDAMPQFRRQLLWYSFVLAKRRRWLGMGFEGRRLQRRQAWQGVFGTRFLDLDRQWLILIGATFRGELPNERTCKGSNHHAAGVKRHVNRDGPVKLRDCHFWSFFRLDCWNQGTCRYE